MKAKFKHPKKIDGQFYGKGEHTLPDAHADHWFVKALIKSGDIVVLGEAKAQAPSESAEKAEKSEEKAQAPQPQGKSNKAK